MPSTISPILHFLLPWPWHPSHRVLRSFPSLWTWIGLCDFLDQRSVVEVAPETRSLKCLALPPCVLRTCTPGKLATLLGGQQSWKGRLRSWDHRKKDREKSSHLSLPPHSVSPVIQSCPTLWDAEDCSTPGLAVHHQPTELTQTRAHCIGDAVQPHRPLSSPSPPTLNLSQHQGLFQWVGSSHQVATVLEFQLQYQFFQWIFRTDFF